MEHVTYKGGLMTERIQQLRNYICGRKQKVFRRNAEWKLAENFQQQGFSPLERSAAAFEAVLKAETPAFIPRARLAFLRTVADLPELYTPAEQEAMRAEFSFCEKGVPFNYLTRNFIFLLSAHKNNAAGAKSIVISNLAVPLISCKSVFIIISPFSLWV